MYLDQRLHLQLLSQSGESWKKVVDKRGGTQLYQAKPGAAEELRIHQ